MQGIRQNVIVRCSSEIRKFYSSLLLSLKAFSGAKRICYDLCNGIHEDIALLLIPSSIKLDRNSARKKKKLPFGFLEREELPTMQLTCQFHLPDG